MLLFCVLLGVLYDMSRNGAYYYLKLVAFLLENSSFLIRIFLIDRIKKSNNKANFIIGFNIN